MTQPSSIPPTQVLPPHHARPQGVQPPHPGPASSPSSPRRGGTEPTAVGALVTGLLGFVVPLLGLVAIVLGGIGLDRTKRRGTGGRGMAATGVTLGSIQVVVTAVAVVGGLLFWNAYGDDIEQELAQAEQLTQTDLSLPGLALDAVTGGVSIDELRELAGGMGSSGELRDLADQCQGGDTAACDSLLDQVPDGLLPEGAEDYLP